MAKYELDIQSIEPLVIKFLQDDYRNIKQDILIEIQKANGNNLRVVQENLSDFHKYKAAYEVVLAYYGGSIE